MASRQVTQRNSKIANIIDKLHSLRVAKGAPAAKPQGKPQSKQQNKPQIRSARSNEALAARRDLLFGERAVQKEAQSAAADLERRKLSRTPTIYEEMSAIDEIAEDVLLREEEATATIDTLATQQAEAYAVAVYEAITSDKSIFAVQVPMVKELTEAYAAEMSAAITTGDSQMLAQLGVPGKFSKLDKGNVAAISKILARVYVEKRSADMKFDLLKASILQSVDVLLSPSKGEE